jgi:hypothetical protein
MASSMMLIETEISASLQPNAFLKNCYLLMVNTEVPQTPTEISRKSRQRLETAEQQPNGKNVIKIT